MVKTNKKKSVKLHLEDTISFECFPKRGISLNYFPTPIKLGFKGNLKSIITMIVQKLQINIFIRLSDISFLTNKQKPKWRHRSPLIWPVREFILNNIRLESIFIVHTMSPNKRSSFIWQTLLFRYNVFIGPVFYIWESLFRRDITVFIRNNSGINW